MYNWNHFTVSGAAAATSSKLHVDSVDRMKIAPCFPAARNIYHYKFYILFDILPLADAHSPSS